MTLDWSVLAFVGGFILGSLVLLPQFFLTTIFIRDNFFPRRLYRREGLE